MLRGIVFVFKTGIAWEDLPAEVFRVRGITCYSRRSCAGGSPSGRSGPRPRGSAASSSGSGGLRQRAMPFHRASIWARPHGSRLVGTSPSDLRRWGSMGIPMLPLDRRQYRRSPRSSEVRNGV
ncbi:hypothetical protein D7X32_09250 [Corallococcus carmarthensis]|uniref:Transposase n=1 Tax=Corallococcus carmarthensis TaxID=2316728 RepID=A0A3A8KLF4_9BACT|nr:hypothetical protein D7X32_09250 [Corallococcus carmarthensis]